MQVIEFMEQNSEDFSSLLIFFDFNELEVSLVNINSYSFKYFL